ncbi:hypothetical protein Golomagni_03914 [Golovinomyces magnicellulatus]|nr:hypothetical protein Golomagni_03914 [Golovinomyces magnicellulatus]
MEAKIRLHTDEPRQSYDSHDLRSTSDTTLNCEASSKDQAQVGTLISKKTESEVLPTMLVTVRSSIETYADSDDNLDLINEETRDDDFYPLILEKYSKAIMMKLRATNPTNFAEYFPSSRILSICHDILSHDGHMNLRIDTECFNRREVVQLFHLCIQDLKKRQFSLRRYERTSGHEVCKTMRRYIETAPVLPRSLTTALAHIKLSSSPSNILQKLLHDDKSYKSRSTLDNSSRLNSNSKLVPTNIIHIEFSNYAQVDIRCRESRFGKRYEFEYWGHQYVWRRISKHGANFKQDNYYLYRSGYAQIIAYIVPELQNAWRRYQEQKRGNWIPPCGMWISEAVAIEGGDVADVIIAAGLVALVDDNIEKR